MAGGDCRNYPEIDLSPLGLDACGTAQNQSPIFFFFVKVYQKTLHAGGNDGVWAPWCATSYFIMKFVI